MAEPPLPPVSTESSPLRSEPGSELVGESIAATKRSQVRRHRDRASYDPDQIHAILDEGFICHLACHSEGTTWMIPTAYGRRGSELLLHGAAANHLFAAAAGGAEVVATVTHLDGMVIARSTFSHSINFRSVVIFGQAAAITEPDDKAAALEAIVEHMLPGRTREARQPTPNEIRTTSVLSLPLSEASAKIRTGPPADGDGADGTLPVWAGTIPLRMAAGEVEPSPDLNREGLAAGASPSWSLQPNRWGRLSS